MLFYYIIMTQPKQHTLVQCYKHVCNVSDLPPNSTNLKFPFDGPQRLNELDKQKLAESLAKIQKFDAERRAYNEHQGNIQNQKPNKEN